MITLYFESDDAYGNEIKRRLDDMVLAYKTVTQKELINSELPPGIELPAIKENGTLVTGIQKLESYLLALEQELEYSRSITGDSCYYHPDTGKIC